MIRSFQATRASQFGQYDFRDFEGPVDVCLRVRRADGALFAGCREQIDAAFDERAAIVAVEIKVVTRSQFVPIRTERNRRNKCRARNQSDLRPP